MLFPVEETSVLKTICSGKLTHSMHINHGAILEPTSVNCLHTHTPPHSLIVQVICKSRLTVESSCSFDMNPYLLLTLVKVILLTPNNKHNSVMFCNQHM